MEAQRQIAGAAFGPEALKVIGKAFDDAWSEIEAHFVGDTLVTQAARLNLANAILGNATEDGRDSDALKNAALEAMAMTPRKRNQT